MGCGSNECLRIATCMDGIMSVRGERERVIESSSSVGWEGNQNNLPSHALRTPRPTNLKNAINIQTNQKWRIPLLSKRESPTILASTKTRRRRVRYAKLHRSIEKATSHTSATKSPKPKNHRNRNEAADIPIPRLCLIDCAEVNPSSISTRLASAAAPQNPKKSKTTQNPKILQRSPTPRSLIVLL